MHLEGKAEIFIAIYADCCPSLLLDIVVSFIIWVALRTGQGELNHAL